MRDATLVTTPEQLDAAVFRLQGARRLAIDTEFMRESTYSPQLCLVQAVAAVFGTGAVLGLFMYLPLQLLATGLGFEPTSGAAQALGLLTVIVFALVTGRIIKLATDTGMFTGVAAALTYFLVVNYLVVALRGPGT